MTCKELRLYFEDPSRVEGAVHDEVEHLAQCEECARFVEARRELSVGLRLMRLSVPKLPSAVDDAVVANYRRRLADRRVPARRSFSRWPIALATVSATAAMAFLVAFLWLSRDKGPVAVAPAGAHEGTLTAKVPVTEPKASVVEAVKRPVRRLHRVRPSSQATANDNPLAADFRSLMYCDELSCGGDLEWIRVQLPAAAAAYSAERTPANGVVYADVLVGADGIARGIRIVE